MSPDQVVAAKERARQVVNGFKRVSERNARDALALAELVELRDEQIAALVQRLDVKEKLGSTADDGDFLQRLFGGFGSPFRGSRS